jgi:hypothetical protein
MTTAFTLLAYALAVMLFTVICAGVKTDGDAP